MNLPWTSTSVLHSSITFHGWKFGPGVRAVALDDALGFDMSGSGVDSTLSDGVAEDAYLSCILVPSSTLLDFNGVQVNIGIMRKSWWSARRFAVYTSMTGFELGDEVFISELFGNGDRNEVLTLSFFLPEAGFGAIADAFEIRIVPYAVRYGGHEVLVTDFSLVGDVDSYQLNLVASGGGSAAAVPDKTIFFGGETAVLSAMPDEGFRFAGWSGAIEGKGNPRHVAMDDDKVITALFEPLPEPHMEVGSNLSGVSDWSTSMVFKDLLKRMRTWKTCNADGSGGWDSGMGHLIPVDLNEWPSVVPFDPGGGLPAQAVHTILVTANEAGPHTLFYEGGGDFYVRLDGQTKHYPPADGCARSYPLMVDRQSRVELYITESWPVPNHLKNFKLVPDAYLNDFVDEPFHPLFIDRSAGFPVIRFMDWGAVNDSELEFWADRTRPEHYTQTRSVGVAFEMMIDFCNKQDSDAWICIPHLADNYFVEQVALLVRDMLNANLKVYVEYSNETWNSNFTQYDYIQEQGELLGLDENSWIAANKYSALRSAEIWSLFEAVFGSQADERVVNVLGTHTASTSVTRYRLAGLNDPLMNPHNVYPDVLAIAPYFGHNFRTDELPPSVPDYPLAESLAGSISQELIEALREPVAAQKALADEQGLLLVCYEAGQHFTGLGVADDDEVLISVLEEANRHPLMYQRYYEYLDMLQEEGVELCVHYLLCGRWGKSGAWGSLEYIDQPTSDAVKYSAIENWIEANRLDTGVE